jgi:universal stress protein E
MPVLLVCSDLEDKSRGAVARALGIAPGARLILLHVARAGAGEDELERARAALAAQAEAEEVELHVLTGRVADAVADAAELWRADLVLTGPHASRPLGDALVGAFQERILRAGRRPLLVVNRGTEGPYRQVVAASDLSPGARDAVVAAGRLGLLDDATVTLLHAFQAPAKGQLLQVGVEPDAVHAHVHRAARDAVAELQAFAGGLGLPPERLRLETREGRPAEVIEAFTKEAAADLVIVGTRGQSGIRRAALGSVADRVLRRVRCDVLVVPPG